MIYCDILFRPKLIPGVVGVVVDAVAFDDDGGGVLVAVVVALVVVVVAAAAVVPLLAMADWVVFDSVPSLV